MNERGEEKAGTEGDGREKKEKEEESKFFSETNATFLVSFMFKDRY